MILMAPRDSSDLARMMQMSLKIDEPCAMRFPRDTTPFDEVPPVAERRSMEPGKAEVLIDPEEGGVVIWAYGALVNEARKAAFAMEADGVRVGLVDARFAKPLDEDLLNAHLSTCKALITVEEHQRQGGFGSAVLESANRLRAGAGRVRVLAIEDQFIEHATTREEQLASQGLDQAGIERAARRIVQRVQEA